MYKLAMQHFAKVWQCPTNKCSESGCRIQWREDEWLSRGSQLRQKTTRLVGDFRSFSHNHGSVENGCLKGNYYWRDLFLTSMIMGGSVDLDLFGRCVDCNEFRCILSH